MFERRSERVLEPPKLTFERFPLVKELGPERLPNLLRAGSSDGSLRFVKPETGLVEREAEVTQQIPKRQRDDPNPHPSTTHGSASAGLGKRRATTGAGVGGCEKPRTSIGAGAIAGR